MPEHLPLPQGFDAPVEDAANDHLNRWPLAQQIYNVAANGPPEWAVRIGVYGEWGTGKTSVLKFVSSMAKLDEHIVVWFDPWAFTDETEMWRTYVKSIHDALEDRLGPIEEVKNLAKGKWLTRSSAVPKIFGIANKQVGELTDMGLAWLKKYFYHHTEALKQLRHVLKSVRVFVIIDDLDRTAAELVPDILYALKEVMDIPGFSFVSGFDPSVVGEVLGDKHPGFGDGLKFLEKIIDYPIWLPPVKPDGLEKIALADRKRHCPYVPVEGLKDVLPSLPQNPRAIRQFIRLLALLRSQTDRYDDRELRWSIILAASAIKVCYPKLADLILGDSPFWHTLRMLQIRREVSGKRKEAEQEIKAHLDEKMKSLGHDLGETGSERLKRAILSISSHLESWGSDNFNFIRSQIYIVEQPQAVTWKEFDGLLATLDAEEMLKSLKSWICLQARLQHHRETDVAIELCIAGVERFCDDLHKADVGFDPQIMSRHEQAASTVFKLIKVLVMEMGAEIEMLREAEWIPLGDIFTKLTPLAAATNPAHVKLWPAIKRFLLQLATNSAANLKKLDAAIHELRRNMHTDAKTKSVVDDLRSILDHHLCRMAANGLTQQGFVYRSFNSHSDFERIGYILINCLQPRYAEYRSQALLHFKTAMDNPNVCENAYRLADWLNEAFLPGRNDHMQTATPLLQDKEMTEAIWNAATRMPFSKRCAYELRDFPGYLKSIGIEVPIPSWWNNSIKEYADGIQQTLPDETAPTSGLETGYFSPGG